MIKIKTLGNFYHFYKFAKQFQQKQQYVDLDTFGQRGVNALAAATPVESGISASSWSYRIFMRGRYPSIEWFNNNVDESGTPIVILLQYGHATGTGGYVQGYDFINPTMQPIFDAIEEYVWKAVRQ